MDQLGTIIPGTICGTLNPSSKRLESLPTPLLALPGARGLRILVTPPTAALQGPLLGARAWHWAQR